MAHPWTITEDALNNAMDKHHREEWVDFESTEILWEPAPGTEDDGEDRLLYHFGDICPLPLWDGAQPHEQCRSYKDKQRYCSSLECEEFARNYLAKHAYESTNHPETKGNRTASFAAASSAFIQTSHQTASDRQWHRDQHQAKMRQQANNRKGKGKNAGAPSPPHFPPAQNSAGREQHRRSRSPPRGPREDRPRRHRSERGRSSTVARREPIGAGSGHGGRHSDIEGSEENNAIASAVARVQSTSRALADESTALVVRSSRRGVRLQLSELEVLSGCLQRAIDSQKRLCEQLTFFSRQFEDEKKILLEANVAVSSMIIKGRLEARG